MTLSLVGFLNNATLKQTIELPDGFVIKEIHEYGDDKVKTIYKVSPSLIVADEGMVQSS